MLQYQYVFGGDLSVVVRQWLVAIYPTKFSGSFTNRGFFLSRAAFENLIQSVPSDFSRSGWRRLICATICVF